MKLNRLGLAGILFQFICISRSPAQRSPDSVLYVESLAQTQQIYLSEIGDNAGIYHGREFIRNGQKAVGFPFYESDGMFAGSISYQGTLYPDRKFYYNLVSDEVIIHNYSQNALITLSSEKVDSFNIGNHVFLQLLPDKTNGLSRAGYYEKLSPGEPAMYAKRVKRLVSGTGSEETKYIQYNNYFIKFKNVYYEVDGKKALLVILKDAEDVLKKYIRTNKINFKKNLEPSLVLTTIYYSQLKQ